MSTVPSILEHSRTAYFNGRKVTAYFVESLKIDENIHENYNSKNKNSSSKEFSILFLSCKNFEKK